MFYSFFLGDSPVSEFFFLFLLFYKIQAPGNHPRERIQQTVSTWCSQKLVHIGVCFNSHVLLQYVTSFEYVVIVFDPIVGFHLDPYEFLL